MDERYLANFSIALEAVQSNKLRSLLTALGIIFGVAAVIAMLAIGNGAQQEILEQIKLVGANNIVIEPVVQQKEEELEETINKAQQKNFSNGLTLLDVESIEAIVPNIERASPEILIETSIIKGGVKRSAKLVGVEPAYFDIGNFELQSGKMFNQQQLDFGRSVCIIGNGVASKFFTQENPIGKMIKCGPHWLKIIGVLEDRFVSKKSISNLGIRDYNMDVYCPIKTTLIRYKNRALITKGLLERLARQNNDDQQEKPVVSYHQLDRLVIQVKDSENLTASAEVISRLLARRHYDQVDFQVKIPELLLKQQQKTKNIFQLRTGGDSWHFIARWWYRDYEYHAGFRFGKDKRNRT